MGKDKDFLEEYSPIPRSCGGSAHMNRRIFVLLLRCPERPFSLSASQARRYFTNLLLVGFGFSRTDYRRIGHRCSYTGKTLHYRHDGFQQFQVQTDLTHLDTVDKTEIIIFKTTGCIIVCHSHCHNATSFCI